MNSRTLSPLTTSARRTSTSGSTVASCCSMSAWIVVLIGGSLLPSLHEESGPAPAFRTTRKRKLRLLLIAPERLCGGACAVPVDAVVAPIGTQSGGQRERLPGVLRTPQLEQRAT